MTKASLILLAPCLWLTAGCKRLPPAPDNLEELTNHFYLHFEDEDPEHIVSGLLNARVWLDAHFEEAVDGYEVYNLTSEAVEGLEGVDPNLEGQVGVAVATDLDFPVEDLVKTVVSVDSTVMNPDAYPVYDRTFVTDRDCFLNRECEMVTYDIDITSTYPLGIVVSSKNRSQFRWIETDEGLACVQRSWMLQPAEVNVNWLEVDQQFYFAVQMPYGDATRRIDAGWLIMRTGALPVSEAMVMQLAVGAMRDSANTTADYLAEQE